MYYYDLHQYFIEASHDFIKPRTYL